MLTSTYTQSLGDYFRQSGRFYFAIINREGNFVFVNPLFHEHYLHIGANFQGQPASIFFERERFKKIHGECFRNPGTTLLLDVPVMTVDGRSVCTRWEFSVSSNEEKGIDNLQAIGFEAEQLDPYVHMDIPGRKKSEDQLRRPAALVANLPNQVLPKEFNDDSRRKEAEDQLRKSEENIRNLIYNLKQGVILQDNKGLMTVCNQAALDMLGLSEDQLLGKTPFDPRWNVIREDGSNFPGGDHPVPMVLKTKKPVLDVVMGVYRPTTEDRVWLRVNAEPVTGPDQEILNVVSSFADITEQKRLSKQLLEQEVQKQRMLIQATIDGQERERLEIGKELHDNINQHLTTTRLYLEVAREKATGEVREMISLSHKTLADIINEIRHLSQSLVPPTLGDIGLIESMHDLCDSLKRAHTFNIDFFSRYFSEEGLPGNLKLMLFRITQEQVNNIVRHSKARYIQIRLQSDAEYITLTIADDGIGFDPAHLKKGLGFSNITNRAGLFYGKVEIEAAPGKGCVLSAIIPLAGNLEGDELI